MEAARIIQELDSHKERNASTSIKVFSPYILQLSKAGFRWGRAGGGTLVEGAPAAGGVCRRQRRPIIGRVRLWMAKRVKKRDRGGR